jgi:hypothetical protein
LDLLKQASSPEFSEIQQARIYTQIFDIANIIVMVKHISTHTLCVTVNLKILEENHGIILYPKRIVLKIAVLGV